MWVYWAALAGCPTGYTPTDAAIDVVAWVFNRYALLDRSQGRRKGK